MFHKTLEEVQRTGALSIPIVVRSFEVNNDTFRPPEEDEELLGPEMPYLYEIDALVYLAKVIWPDVAFSVNLLASIVLLVHRDIETRELREFVFKVRRVNDRLMIIKLVLCKCTLNVVSAYAPYAGLDEEVKQCFWEGLDEIVRQVPHAEKLFIRGDFNGQIGSIAGGYDEVHGGFGFGERNGGGTSLLDFAKALGLVIVNSSFPKREKHLVTFQNAVAQTQIDYVLFRRCDRGLCKDCKAIPGEILVTRQRLLVLDIGVMVKRRKIFARERPIIRWGALTKDKAQELEGRLSAMGAWKSSGDASTMWSTTTNCISEAAREVLGVSTGVFGKHKGDWWWNKVVQGKVEAKKEAYQTLVGSIGEEERRACMESYKVARKEAELAVIEAKTAAYSRMYED
ncbi:uncharacterized protein LOC142182154 [Nicotiana tabacum]|uniref:Uncharacterized protein LOC142182154 n=1 Tax=Nicotiana tabacum TaxID=4097 RepID=A0AC58URY4_TOBAC